LLFGVNVHVPQRSAAFARSDPNEHDKRTLRVIVPPATLPEEIRHMSAPIEQSTKPCEDTSAHHGAANNESGNRRRKFIAGAGIAGAAAIGAKSGVASAANGDPVVAGQDFAATVTTSVTNSGTSTDRTNNAIKGVIDNAGNNSHAVLGTTNCGGHAVAGVVGSTSVQPTDGVAATWGRHFGAAPAVEGDNRATDIPIAGDGVGVLGLVFEPTNGSHAVKGVTNGGGHALAGDPLDRPQRHDRCTGWR
jgi:hypothetical protein